MCLDLNVLVAAEIAREKGRQTSVPLRFVEALRKGRIDLVISVFMLDRLGKVLMRPPLNFSPEVATERAQLFAEYARLPGLLLVGGGIAPIRDEEDRHVLESALAGGARYLATYNLRDFESIGSFDPALGQLAYRNLGILHPRELAEKLGI